MINGNEFETLCDLWEKDNPLYSISWTYDIPTDMFKVILARMDDNRGEEEPNVTPPSVTAHIPFRVAKVEIFLTFETLKNQLELYLKYGIEI